MTKIMTGSPISPLLIEDFIFFILCLETIREIRVYHDYHVPIREDETDHSLLGY